MLGGVICQDFEDITPQVQPVTSLPILAVASSSSISLKNYIISFHENVFTSSKTILLTVWQIWCSVISSLPMHLSEVSTLSWKHLAPRTLLLILLFHDYWFSLFSFLSLASQHWSISTFGSQSFTPAHIYFSSLYNSYLRLFSLIILPIIFLMITKITYLTHPLFLKIFLKWSIVYIQ